MKLAKIFSILLALSLLCSCGQPAATDVTTAPAQDIHLENGYVVVVDADAPDAAYQAAVCIRATLDEKVGLVKPQIVTTNPGSNAIVVEVDPKLPNNEYQVSSAGTSLYVRAGSPHVLLHAAKLLRQAILDAENIKVITTKMCDKLCGSLDLADLPFTFMTQNILYLDAPNGHSLLERAPRFKLLMEEYHPDILAVQESSGDWFKYYKKYFGDTYFTINTASNTILLRSDRFELLEDGITYLSATPSVESKFEEATSNRNCAWALVKDTITGREIFLCNAHLDPQSEEARVKQAVVLVEQMKPYFDKYPSILCGDFNCDVDSPVHDTVSQIMTHARTDTLRDLSEVSITYHSMGSKTKFVDFIYHNQFRTNRYRILSDHYNGYVSDHYGVLAEFQMDK